MPFKQVKNKYNQYIWKINIGSYPIWMMNGCTSPLDYHYQTLTATMELLKEEPQTSTKTSPSSQSITPVQAAKRKTQSINRSTDLWSTYLQQFQWYPLPLIPLRETIPICQSPWPLWPNYNPTPLLEEQAHWAEGHQEQEVVEAPQEEEEAYQEMADRVGAMPNQPNRRESPQAHYQWFLKEIVWKLRASSGNSPHTF